MSAEISISKDVLVRHLQGESVLLDLKSRRYFGLDEIGTRMWQLLAEHRDPEAVIETMIEEFEVERGRLERDLEAFLTRLENAELVTVRRPRETRNGGPPAPPA